MRLSADGTAKRPALSNPTALLIVDIQTYTATINEGCEHFTGTFPSVMSNIAELASTFRVTPNCEVIFTYLQSLTPDRRDISVDYKLSGPALCAIPGPQDDNVFLNECHPIRDQDILLPKTSCSVFHSTNLHYVLSNLGIRHLVIVGQLTDQCITSAARGAADLGYYVTVVTDACVARSTAEEERGRANVDGFARLLDTTAVVQEVRAARSQEQMLVQRVVDLLQEKGFHEAAEVVLGELGDGNSMSQEGIEGPIDTEVSEGDPVFEMVPHPPKNEEIDLDAYSKDASMQKAGDSPVMVGAKRDLPCDEAFTPFDMVGHPQSKANNDSSIEAKSVVAKEELDQRHQSELISTQMAPNQAGDVPSDILPGDEKSKENTRDTPVDQPVSTPAEALVATMSDHFVAQEVPTTMVSGKEEADKLDEAPAQLESIAGETKTTKITMIPQSASQRVVSDTPTKSAGDGLKADGTIVDQQDSMERDTREIPIPDISEHTTARNVAATELETIAGNDEEIKTSDGSLIVPIAIERAISDPPAATTDDEEYNWNAARVSSIGKGIVSLRDPPSCKKQGPKQEQLEIMQSSAQSPDELSGDGALGARGFLGHSVISDLGQTHPCDDSFIEPSTIKHEKAGSFAKTETSDEAKHLSEAGTLETTTMVVQEEKNELQMPQLENMMEDVVEESSSTKQVERFGPAMQLVAEDTKHGMSEMEKTKGKPAVEAVQKKLIGQTSQAHSGEAERSTIQRKTVDPPASKPTGKSFIGKQFL